MSIFKKIKQIINDHATKISPDCLEKGKKYEVYEFKSRRSDYANKDGSFPQNLVAYFKINNLRYYTTLPALYNNQLKMLQR